VGSCATSSLSGQTTVIAHVEFAGDTYISSDLARGTTFELGSLTRLPISRDSNNVFHYGLLTYIPDSNAIVTQSYTSGIQLYEDWQGNSISAPRHFARRALSLAASGDKRVDIIQDIQVCNTIDGYNYAPDDPAGGATTWSETSCNTYNLPAMTTGPTIGPAASRESSAQNQYPLPFRLPHLSTRSAMSPTILNVSAIMVARTIHTPLQSVSISLNPIQERLGHSPAAAHPAPPR